MTDAEYAGLPPEALAAGCRQWTNTPGTRPGTTSALCRVAPNVSCAGDRLYYVNNVPCIKYACRRRTCAGDSGVRSALTPGRFARSRRSREGSGMAATVT